MATERNMAETIPAEGGGGASGAGRTSGPGSEGTQDATSESLASEGHPQNRGGFRGSIDRLRERLGPRATSGQPGGSPSLIVAGTPTVVAEGVNTQGTGIEPQDVQNESPVPGLTAEDVQLFIASGETVEGLNQLVARVGLQAFLQQALPRLEYLRSQPVLTPEQIAQQQTEERAKKIEQLEAERVDLQNMPENTEDERRLKELRQARIGDELRSLSGGGGGGGSERPGGPEEPPPSDGDLEYEASPERGRQIVEEIVKWEGLRAAGKLEEVGWKELNNLYLQHEIHIEAARIVSLRVEPSEPKEPQQTVLEDYLVNPENLKDKDTNEEITPLEELLEVYRTGGIVDRDKFLREVDVYFKEAQRVGLLRELDQVLSVAWREVRMGIGRNQNSAQIMPSVNQEIQYALSSFLEAYSDRDLVDPEINRLAGIGGLYVPFAKGRFATAIRNRDVDGITGRDSLDHEFHLGQEEATGETFWRATHGWYIEVHAQTPEEFMIAADSYISTLESITADPKKILDQATQFVEVLSKSDGAQELLKTEKGKKFINRLILGIEGRVGVFGADDSNERYAGDNYKAYLDYTNKDGKGPDRYLTLTQMFDGRIAAALWKLDKDPRWEILFATYGSRGQLAKMSIAQRDRVTDQGLFNQAYALLVEEMLGVQIRNTEDVEKITQFMPDRKFATFFDGLYRYDHKRERTDYGDANIRAWNAVKDIPDSQLTPAQRQSKRNGIIRLGRIQQELRDGEKLTELSESDQRFYDQALAEAKKAVDIAFQLYGVFGEKSKRAGGVFKTAEKTDAEGKKYQYFVPIHWAEKWVQCAETLTKIQYAHLSAKERTAKVKQARDKNIVLLKRDGFETVMVDADGNPMKLKRPKEDPNATDELARDVSGNVTVEEVPVDFYTATHHPYGDWSGHTYWSYQEEHRHLLLSPTMFNQARQMRDGKLRPEDADPVAVQLLILDPTLRRVRRFEKGFEDRERKLTMAAVEDSYQSHWRITRELHRAFWPEYGTPAEDIGIYYGLQDYGGYRKTIESMRARIAEDPERFARRGRRLLPDLHNPVASLSEYLGQGSTGALGAVRMMGYPMYRLAGTFAWDKFAGHAEFGGKLSDALLGGVGREGMLVEGLLLKLTNNSEKLQELLGKIPTDPRKWTPEAQVAFCWALKESLGRLEVYEKLLTDMESRIRNASGALWLEEVDVLTDSGELNSDIEERMSALPAISYTSSANKKDVVTRDDLANFITEADEILALSEEEFNKKFNREIIDESKSPDTGSGRHSAKEFHATFGKLLLDYFQRGGAELYPNERYFYSRIHDPIAFYEPDGKGGTRIAFSPTETIWTWLFSKFVPT